MAKGIRICQFPFFRILALLYPSLCAVFQAVCAFGLAIPIAQNIEVDLIVSDVLYPSPLPLLAHSILKAVIKISNSHDKKHNPLKD